MSALAHKTPLLTPTEELDAKREGMSHEASHAITWAAIHDLASPDEPFVQFLGRWDHFMGARELGRHRAVEIVDWMASNLLTHPIGEWTLPGYSLTINGIRNHLDAEKASRALDIRVEQFEERMLGYARCADDVERLGGSTERVEFTRKLVAHGRNLARERVAEIRASIQAQLDAALAASVVSRNEDASRWRLPVQGELTRKPTPASIDDWFEATYAGRGVWCNGHIADLTGEPHLKGWQDRKIKLTPFKPNPVIDTLIGSVHGEIGTVIGVYDQVLVRKKTRKAVPVAAIPFGERVLGFDTRYVRYFLSKYQGATFVDQADSSVVLVIHAGAIVGVMGSWCNFSDANGRVSTPADVAERFRMASDSSATSCATLAV